jgi:hypothetical protein
MSLKIQRGSLETEINLERAVEEVDDHRLRRAPTQLPSASSLAQRLLLLPTIKFLGALVLGKKVKIGEGLKAKDLVKG